MLSWQCKACGYVWAGPEPPQTVWGVRFAQTGDCTPDEHADVCPPPDCPDCGSQDIGNLKEVTTC